MKYLLLLITIFLLSVTLKAQNCDSAAYIFFGNFDSLHVCTKSISKMDEKYWGIAYDIGAFSIHNSKNKILFNFPSPGGDNYEVYCFHDSIIIYERFWLPFIMDEEPYVGIFVEGPRNIYKYILTKSATGFGVKKENVYKDLTISADSLLRVKQMLNLKIEKYDSIIDDYESYVQKYGALSDNYFSGTSFYWLVFLAYYNDDKDCELYLKDWDKYIPYKSNDSPHHATIIKNILWYKTLKKEN